MLAAALQVQYQDLLVRAGYLEQSEMNAEEQELLLRYNALSFNAKAVLLELMPLMEQKTKAELPDSGG